MAKKSLPTISRYIVNVKLKSGFPDEVDYLEDIAEKIIKGLNLTVVNKIQHKFTPQGITLVYIISQSHLILHTWPEYNFINIDLFSCADIKKSQISQILKSIFPARNIDNLTYS